MSARIADRLKLLETSLFFIDRYFKVKHGIIRIYDMKITF